MSKTSPFNLPETANQIDHKLCVRAPADPIGLAGLPTLRSSLDYLVERMCNILKAAGYDGIKGKPLALELINSTNTRTLRHLVAYARVHKHITEIVGIPGSGYYWCDPATEWGREKITAAIAHAKQMGRCFFFIAANHSHGSPAMTAAQLVFDWAKADAKDEVGDELTALMQSQNVTVGNILEALIELMSETPDGREALRQAGQRHAEIMLPKKVVAHLKQYAQQMHESTGELLGLLGNNGQGTDNG